MSDEERNDDDSSQNEGDRQGSASDIASLIVEVPGSDVIEVPADLPVLPVRDVVVYPGVTMPLAIGRERSLAALDDAGQDGFLLVVSQRDPMTEDPALEDLYEVGTIVRVMRIIDARREGKQALVVGIARADGILEDGRVRGEAAHTLSDPVGQFPRGDPVAPQVVEPRALLLLIKQIMKAGHCSRSNAWSTRLLTFMPSSCMTVAPGALAPKRLMPTTSSA